MEGGDLRLGPPELLAPPAVLVAFTGTFAFMGINAGVALLGRATKFFSQAPLCPPLAAPHWFVSNGYRIARVLDDCLVYGLDRGVYLWDSWVKVSLSMHLMLGLKTADQKVRFQEKAAALWAALMAACGLVAVLYVRLGFPFFWCATLSACAAWPVGLALRMLYENRPWYPPPLEISATAMELADEAIYIYICMYIYIYIYIYTHIMYVNRWEHV